MRRWRIIPAYAGSTRHHPDRARPSTDHPRIRGEHVAAGIAAGAVAGSSPHTRGARRPSGRSSNRSRIIPAYAGSTGLRRRRCRGRRDHPRIRGEHACSTTTRTRSSGSSPHTRGALRFRSCCHRRRRIIPAYAGSTRGRDEGRRNEDGSSPHTRGARPGRSSRHRHGGIIPAYAGSTRPTPDGLRRRRDHPRIRGEHDIEVHARAGRRGSSPHTRGAPRRPESATGCVRIIPAYAGSTSAAFCR